MKIDVIGWSVIDGNSLASQPHPVKRQWISQCLTEYRWTKTSLLSKCNLAQILHSAGTPDRINLGMDAISLGLAESKCFTWCCPFTFYHTDRGGVTQSHAKSRKVMQSHAKSRKVTVVPLLFTILLKPQTEIKVFNVLKDQWVTFNCWRIYLF